MQASRLKDALNRIANQAAGDYNAFTMGVEKWFDDEMDRVSGWYRRQSQKILGFIAIAVVLGFNIDSITLFSQLREHPPLIDAAKLVDNAQGYAYLTTQVLENVRFGWNPDPALCMPAWQPPQPTLKTNEQPKKASNRDSATPASLPPARKPLGLGLVAFL